MYKIAFKISKIVQTKKENMILMVERLEIEVKKQRKYLKQ